MLENHPQRQELLQLLVLEPGNDRRIAVMAHVKECVRCQVRLALLRLGQAPQRRDPSVTISAIQAAKERELTLAQERIEAPQLLEELLNHPGTRQQLLVKNSPRFQTWGLAELLLKRAWGARYRDIRYALALSRLAGMLIEHLSPSRYGKPLLADLEARAWVYYGNGKRIAEDYDAAEESLEIAEQILAMGTGDPLESALLLRARAFLRAEQGKAREGTEILVEVRSLYERVGDYHLAAVTMTDQATLHEDLGEFEVGAALVEAAVSGLDGDRDPTQVAIARHMLALFYQHLGRSRQAQDLLAQARAVYEKAGDQLALLRVEWLEGRIALDLGHPSVAQACLEAAKDGFLQHDLGEAAAEVFMELGLIYASEARPEKLKDLGVAMVPLVHMLKGTQLTCVVMYIHALELGELDLGLAREVLERFRQSCRPDRNPE